MFPTLQKFAPAVTWFIIATILFVMPGSEFPKEDWFEAIYLDELLHIIFIFLLVYLFYFPLRYKKYNWLLLFACLGIIYGVSIEFIQKYWVKGRSFEMTDIICDVLGCAAAYFIGLWKKKYVKK